MPLKEKIYAGLGKIKADHMLKNARILNINTKEIMEGDLAIKGGFIAGMGDVGELIGPATKIIDVGERYVSPGLIDGHVHFESSMVTLTQFARISLAHGTTTIIIDPHEIANILGRKGIELVLREAEKLPLNVFLAIPSCVPASPLETSGGKIGLEEVKPLLGRKHIIGLGEMMDYPGVFQGNPEKISMIKETLERGLLVDGHCPEITGTRLFGCLGAGISSDHESISYEEALEKARLGMKVMLREGSAARCLDDFIPKLLKADISLENFFFVSDDNSPEDLVRGYMDAIVRKSIFLGLSPLQAVSMATINTARHYHIDSLIGSISVGRRADVIILDDLEEFRINRVIVGGSQPRVEETSYPKYVYKTIKYPKTEPRDLWIKSRYKKVRVHVIEIVPGKIITERSIEELEVGGDSVQPDLRRDVLLVAVIERHGKGGNIGRGFVRGFKLREGAFAQSIAHDSHNVIIVGTNYEDMAICANKIKEIQGGIALANSKTLDYLPLPFAGILSIKTVEEVSAKLEELHTKIKEMGCRLEAPFHTLSFLALSVIPKIKITDKGIVDVEEFRIIRPIIGPAK